MDLVLALERAPVSDAGLLLDQRRLCNRCGQDFKRKGDRKLCSTCYSSFRARTKRRPAVLAFIPCNVCGFSVFRQYGRKGGTGVTLCPPCRKERERRAHSAANYRYNEKNRQKRRAYGRAKRVGMTIEDVEVLELRQGGACAICGNKENLHLDHCHESGQVRGLLCGRCNRGLGMFKDDPQRLAGAIAYLGRQVAS